MRAVYFIIPFLLLPIAYSLEIGLSVQEVLSLDITNFGFNDSAMKVFETEILNKGSIPYTAQARIEVFDGNSTFTAWSPSRKMMPGLNAYFPLYWLPDKDGNYTARLRVYYGGEVAEKEENITVTKKETKDVFNVSKVRSYSNFLLIDITAGNYTGKAMIMPENYPQGWIITQATAKNGRAILFYRPVTEKETITLAIASEDGLYQSKRQVVVENEKGFAAMVMDAVFGMIKGV